MMKSMTELQEENIKLRSESTTLRGALKGAAQAANVAGAELKKLREEREKLIDALLAIQSESFDDIARETAGSVLKELKLCLTKEKL